MKNFKKWTLLVGATGALAFNVLCSGGLQQTMRDAALAGAARWVEAGAFGFLDDQLDLTPGDE